MGRIDRGSPEEEEADRMQDHLEKRKQIECSLRPTGNCRIMRESVN